MTTYVSRTITNNTGTRFSFFQHTALLTTLCMALAASAARAEVTYAVANQDPQAESAFSLNFGVFGGVSSATITQTNFLLELDTLGGAKLVDYHQSVEPLTLPGGFDTGPIRVEVTKNTGGTYDETTGEFTSNDVYAIYFEGDLSAFGLESPVHLPGDSSGIVTFDGEQTGSVQMEWRGESALPNPFDPGTYFDFTYACHVESLFAVPSAGDVDGDTDVDLKDVASFMNCLSGQVGFSTPRCVLADADNSGTVEMDDFSAISENLSGPGLEQ
ncbi:MAG: hypothetical protein AABZ47_01185 [Planctomycetota bacterium]